MPRKTTKSRAAAPPRLLRDRLAIGYDRVSTKRQEQEGVSLELQPDAIKTYCAAHALRLVNSFSDPAVSGRSRKKRAGLAKALKKVCAIKGVLVVYSLSRLARSTRDALAILDELRAAGAGLVSVVDNIDTTTAMGEFFYTIIAALARLQSDLNSENVRAAVAYLKKHGRRWSAVIPYGLKLAGDGETLEDDNDEQAVIREMRRLRRDGAGWHKIATELNRRGVPTRLGGSWQHCTVKRILLREA